MLLQISVQSNERILSSTKKVVVVIDNIVAVVKVSLMCKNLLGDKF